MCFFYFTMFISHLIWKASLISVKQSVVINFRENIHFIIVTSVTMANLEKIQNNVHFCILSWKHVE